MKIVTSVVSEVVAQSPDTILMPRYQPPRRHGAACVPGQRIPETAGRRHGRHSDTARFRTFLAMELNVSVESIDAWVLGGHGDSMVPVVGSTIVGGQARLKAHSAGLSRRHRQAYPGRRRGNRRLPQDGSAYYAPSAAIVQMVEAIPLRQEANSPMHGLPRASTESTDLFVGVPVKLGANGVEEIIEFDLTDDESAALQRSADAVRELVEVMDNANGMNSGPVLIRSTTIQTPTASVATTLARPEVRACWRCPRRRC